MHQSYDDFINRKPPEKELSFEEIERIVYNKIGHRDFSKAQEFVFDISYIGADLIGIDKSGKNLRKVIEIVKREVIKDVYNLIFNCKNPEKVLEKINFTYPTNEKLMNMIADKYGNSDGPGGI